MLKVLIDTCVWLELAKDYRNVPLLEAVRQLVDEDELELIIPQLVVDEFGRNKQKVINSVTASQKDIFKRVKSAVAAFGDEASDDLNKKLGDVEHAASVHGQGASKSVSLVEELMNQTDHPIASMEVKTRVAERGIDGLKPFSKSKNSSADAVLIEMYDEMVRAETDPFVKFAFVTINKNDFSDVDDRVPHPDIAAAFNEHSKYYNSLETALSDADLAAGEEFEEYISDGSPRLISDITEALDLLFDQVWYVRHQSLKAAIERGDHLVVPQAEYRAMHLRQTREDIWQGALIAAEKVEAKHGKANLGPFDDLELGVIYGKLSALRWALGEEWDSLDT